MRVELAAIEGLQQLSMDELRALQLTRLRETMQLTATSHPHYRTAFQESGVQAGDLRTLEDLANFPFTTKADLRAAYPFGFFATPLDQVMRIHASSGTTGQPTVVGYTAGDLVTWSALVARSLALTGVRPGMRVHVAYGYGLFTGGLGAHYGAEALGCTVIPVSSGQTSRQVQLICDLRPDVIMATPSYMLAILDEFRNQGRDPAATSLRIGVLGAEPWTEAMRAEIEAAFAIEAYDIYGLSEVLGPGVACETVAAKGGPTLWEDHFYPEIVDPETGVVLADGAQGELVLTSLTKQAMPVVRYRTRDLTRLSAGAGSPMRRLARVLGRSDDMLIIRGVNVFPSQIEELVLQQEALAPHFEIELSRPGRLDEARVRVETRASPSHLDAAERLAARIKDVIGVSVAVELCPPGALERSSGKARRVRDLRR